MGAIFSSIFLIHLFLLKLKPEDVASIHDDILIAKMNPGQVIKID